MICMCNVGTWTAWIMILSILDAIDASVSCQIQGVLVPVRVTKHNDAGVRVRLEGGPGLFGFVPADYVTDDVLPTDPITGQVCLLYLVFCGVRSCLFLCRALGPMLCTVILLS